MSDCRPDDLTAPDVPASHDAPQADDCTGCGVAPDRRTFLRSSALAVAAAMLGLGARQADALAPLAFMHAHAATGATRTYPIPAKDGAEIDKENEVILVRWQNAVYAFALSCPHQNTALRWQEADGRFQCPKHKSQYKPDGTFIQGRATRGMDRFSLRRAANTVVVDLDTLHEEDADESGWAASVVKL